ncbi:Dyp-type peroxidase [Corynebacterium sp. 35RC1]|nr:Dyp-type peroxidase [Corynebacterium sp. 35RC1]
MPEQTSSQPALVTRRAFLAATAVTATAATAACQADTQPSGAAAEGAPGSSGAQGTLGTATVAFDDVHQAGIATPPQAHCEILGLNLRAGVDRAAVTRLLRLWTEDARELTQGRNPVGSLEPEMVSTPANLTITCGVGQRFFSIIGKQEERPEWLADLPEFSLDQLSAEYGQTDLMLQICGDDPLYVAFASRHMVRSGVSYAQVAWVQQGFLNAHGVLEPGQTPRNLFGQKDGTVNPRSDIEFDEQVWIANEGPLWLRGGTAMVLRRIAMNLDTWEMLDRASRENAVGRTLDTGAPLGGSDEFDQANFDARDEHGLPVIDPRSHMALAAPPGGQPEQRMRRRAYNYFQPPVPGSEQLSNAGLLFACFQKDPRTSFIPIQRRLDQSDRLNEWITHVGSAVYAIFPGVGQTQGQDRFWGQRLLEGA